MQGPVLLLVLLLALVLPIAAAQVVLKKCCSRYEMFSGDGRRCVPADWPQDGVNRSTEGVALRPLDEAWVRRWLPPGLPIDTISFVCLPRGYDTRISSRDYNECFNLDPMGTSAYERAITRSVNETSLWDPKRSADEILPGTTIHFVGAGTIARSKRGGGHRYTQRYCVDAAQPPLGPFALRFISKCTRDGTDCALKCCDIEEVLVENRGRWTCVPDNRGYWFPESWDLAWTVINSSFLDPETPSSRNSISNVKSVSRRLYGDEATLVRFAQQTSHEYLFSTWRMCTDYSRKNGTLTEAVIYTEYSRITRGVYWVLRPLCCVSVLLLVVSLGAIASNRSMRRKVHGWCLMCHACCLLAFNLGHVGYYLTISNAVDMADDYPFALIHICEILGFCMYFLLTAAYSWLTAVCANMAWGFSKQENGKSATRDPQIWCGTLLLRTHGRPDHSQHRLPRVHLKKGALPPSRQLCPAEGGRPGLRRAPPWRRRENCEQRRAEACR